MMQRALMLAARAAAAGEVPVGAVLVAGGEVVAEAANRTIGDCDPSAHAEMLAVREAARALGNYRLTGSTLYVTLEPCAMCAGVIIQARVARVVYATPDARAGAAGSVYDVLTGRRLNHHPSCEGGLLAEQAAALLQAFFRQRRGPEPPRLARCDD